MNEDKKKYNLRPTYNNLRHSHIEKERFYLASLDERTDIQEICYKYKVENPRWFVKSMNFRDLAPPDFENFGDPPNPENELSLAVGVIDESTKEKITYLKAIIKECRWAIHDDLQNKQYKKLFTVAREMLNFLETGSFAQENNISQTVDNEKSNHWDQLEDQQRANISHFAKNDTNNHEGAKAILTELEYLIISNKSIPKRGGKINIRGTLNYILDDCLNWSQDDYPVTERKMRDWLSTYVEDFLDLEV